jgi:DNA invertase Pin-like site-specific DNA recombinase
MKVVAYTRVSTREQADTGHGIDAQRTELRRQAELRGWQIVAWCEDLRVSGKDMKQRDQLAEAVRLVECGEAEALVATKIDRVSRSVADFATLVCRANTRGWALVVLDIGLDLTTPMGKFTANVLCAAAELERDMISQRTRDGLAAARAKGVSHRQPARPARRRGEAHHRLAPGRRDADRDRGPAQQGRRAPG